MVTSTESPILQRVIHRGFASITPDTARLFLELNFSEQENERMDELMAKSRDGSISESEKEQLHEFVVTNELLMVFHLLAREALGQLPRV